MAEQKPRQGSEKRKRNVQQLTRYSAEEYAQLVANADAAGYSVGAFTRLQTLTTAGPRSLRRIPINAAVVRELIGHLGRVGNNLNQLTALAHIGDLQGVDVRELEKVREEIHSLADRGMALLGRDP